MKTFVKNYFTFNRADRNAFLALLSVIVLVVSVPYVAAFFHRDEVFNPEQFRNEVLAFELEQLRKTKEDSAQKAMQQNFNYNMPDESTQKAVLTPFPFNPNNLPSEQWAKMGLTERQIKGIKNFEAAGGKFYQKSDFRKLFVISPKEYEVLEPFIQLPDTYVRPKYVKQFKDTIPVVELNAADTSELQLLKGVGPATARRIVWYREKLGGYCRTSQLLEVNGIDSTLYNLMLPKVTVKPSRIKKIDANAATFIELKSHPYISSNVALSIVNYRNMHGKYTSVADLMKSELIDEALFYKIAPYFIVE